MYYSKASPFVKGFAVLYCRRYGKPNYKVYSRTFSNYKWMPAYLPNKSYIRKLTPITREQADELKAAKDKTLRQII